jgi:poly(A) polymerase
MSALTGSPSVAAVMDELAPLADRFGAAGHRLFLVGGTVRDLVTTVVRPDAPPQGDFDLDATTTARPTEIKQLLQGWADAIWTQGERFGTIGAMKRTGTGDVTPGAAAVPVERVFEITTHRAEAYRGDSRKPVVAFSVDIVADLSRRDFTVNAMAIEVTTPSPVLVDPFGGVADLVAKVLRTPLTPAESFSDDPLRMLRAARFVTRYDLVPVPELLDAVGSMAGRLAIVSAERIRDELDKLLAASAPSAGLQFVFATGLGDQALPEVAALADVVADGSRHADALAHTLAIVAALPAGADDRHLRWAGLFVALGPSVARARMQALRSSLAAIDAIGTIVAVYGRLSGGPADPSGDWTAGEVRRLVRDAGPWFDRAVLLARASAAQCVDGRAAVAMARVDGAAAQLASLADREDLGSFAPELDGATVMDVLGLSPGRDVGRAMQFLTELRLDAGPVGTAEATRRLMEWWTDHSS